MPEPRDRAAGVRLHPDDAAELVEMFTFLSDRLDSQDADLLATSFRRFVGSTGYELAELHADIDRFAFLLGGDGERLLTPDQQ
jgi:hypothetical protein